MIIWVLDHLFLSCHQGTPLIQSTWASPTISTESLSHAISAQFANTESKHLGKAWRVHIRNGYADTTSTAVAGTADSSSEQIALHQHQIYVLQKRPIMFNNNSYTLGAWVTTNSTIIASTDSSSKWPIVLGPCCDVWWHQINSGTWHSASRIYVDCTGIHNMILFTTTMQDIMRVLVINSGNCSLKSHGHMCIIHYCLEVLESS